MSRAGGFKSKFSNGKKPEVESKREDDDKLYYRINKKTGRSETNYLEWERSWKNVKILQFPAKYARNRGLSSILARNRMLPEVDTDRDSWLPTAEQTMELEVLNTRPRAIKETEFYLAWRQARLQENATRRMRSQRFVSIRRQRSYRRDKTRSAS